MIKKNTLLLCVIVFMFSTQINAQDKECSGLFYGYYEFFKRGNLKDSYPKWKEVFTKDCSGFRYYDNILSDGEGILDYMITNSSSRADSVKHATDLKQIKLKRIELYPEEALYWKSAAASVDYTYKLIPVEKSYKTLKEVFQKAKEKDSELTSESVEAFFYSSADLYGTETIDFSSFLSDFSNNIKVIQRNSEIRRLKEIDLKLKSDSITLSPDEKSLLDEYKTFKEYFESLEYQITENMQDFLTYSNLINYYTSELEAKKDNYEWLNEVVYTLDNIAKGEIEPNDSLKYTALKDQYIKVYYDKFPDLKPKPNEDITKPDPGVNTTDTDTRLALENYKNKRYKAAIPYLNKVVNKNSGGKKGVYAYYLADSYKRTGNFINAISWFKKAAQYKPGWSSPYVQIGTIFGNKARINSCGKDKVQKLSGYLVAADYLRKACRYDKKQCTYASQYEAAGPTAQDLFNGNYKKGQRVSVTCYGGASTKLR